MTAPALYLDRRAAAAACGVSPDMLDQAIKAGELRAKKHRSKNGGRNSKVLFDPADLRAWVEGWDEA